MKPLRANPGGQIDPKDVVGRDKLIASIWEILETRSVILTAERRIGKTTIIRKMCEEPRERWTPIFQDLERIQTAMEFANDVYAKTTKKLSFWNKSLRKAKEIYDAISGLKLGKVELPKVKEKHWKALLETSVEELASQQQPEQLVFFWDKVPYMIDKIVKQEGEETAKEVLDVLRALRQQHSRFKIVVTGSIGLHHVLTSLKEGGYKNEPFNDMTKIEVGPLKGGEREKLAAQLIAGEQLEVSHSEKAAKHISKQADDFPFYIHHIVAHLRRMGRKAETRDINKSVEQQLTDDNDPWQLRHYRTWVTDYYPRDAEVVLAILDGLATEKSFLTVDEILGKVRQQMQFDDQERLLSLLVLMGQDHYLQKDTKGRRQFRFPLIKRWWQLDRGLSE